MALDAELQDVLRRYCSSLGTTFTSKGSSKVLAQPSNRMLFAKTGSLDQVLGEAESLQAMFRASQSAGHSQTLIPTIHAFGKTSNGKRAFLVTDYRDLSSGLNRNNQRVLGTKLAQMHRHGTSENGQYGFERATHCGATEQDNTWTASWSDFWADRRIGDLVQRSGDRELAALEVQLREKVYPLLFNKEAMKDVRPAIIHGDLWSGNAGTDEETGQPIIFDPSSSYSHNEAELGITKMFGGFGSEFYEAYHEVIPKAEPYYKERQDMYEAYHHLNHFVIFGGSYRSGTIRLFKKLISWAEKEGQKSNGNDGDDSNSGDGKGGKGLRGGGAAPSSIAPTSAMTSQGCSTAPITQPHPQPPPNAGAIAASSMTTAIGHMQAPKEVILPPATPSQIADYFSQMICYLWFSSGIPGRSLPTTPSRSPSITHQPLQSSPLAPRRYIPAPFTNTTTTNGVNPIRNLRPSHAKTASAGNITTGLGPADILASFQTPSHPPAANPRAIAVNTKILNEDPILLRLQPKSRFLRFCREILRTTQVSTSVIALALIYVHRLKAAHPQLKGKDGSEFRLAISSLMLANKILDDNTYLNKTWAEISGMPLIEISKMEVEFWLGLKMELHITKDQYEKELQDLHTLANDRTSAVQQRDAAMKRAILLQQQQQQQFQLQQLSAQSNQWMPYLQLGSNTSSDGMVNDSRYHSLATQTATRHSMGYADETLRNHTFPETFLPMHPFQTQSQGNLPLYDMAGSLPGYHMQSPPYYSRPTSFTLPPSPLSQASAGISLNSGDCGNLSLAVQAALQDPLASSPPFNVNGNSAASSNDPMWSSMHQQGNSASSSMLPQYNELSPKSGASNVSFAFGDHSIAAAAAKGSNGSIEHRPSLSTQSSSTLSGLKRDFEKTNLESASQLESSLHPSKRFAAEPIMSDDLRFYQLTSSSLQNSATHSPTEGRYALRSRSRAPGTSRATSSGRSVSRDGSSLRGAYRISVSPRHASSFSGHTPMTSISRGSIPSRPSTSHDIQSNSAPHPNYHSVFSSALTPNALAAPLDNSIMNQQSTHWNEPYGSSRKVGPLQYYSLAAGEPYGTIGTYLPPPHIRQGWNADVTGGLGGARRTSMVPDYRQVFNNQPRWNDSDINWNRDTSIIRTPVSAPGSQSETSNLASYSSMAPPPPSSEMQHQSKDDLMSLHQCQPHGIGAPFSLDVHSWPLANSASSNFLFPYHLLPPQPQPLHGSTNPSNHHRQSHHYHS